MGQRIYSFDQNMLLSDGLTPLTASGFSQVASASKLLDMGGPQSRSDLGLVGGQARIDMAIVIDVSALVVANSNNLYTFYALGSNGSLASFSNPVVLGSLQLGYGTGLPLGTHSTGGAAAGTGSDSAAGRYEMLLSMEQADINYEFLGLYVAVAGTNGSITFTAFGAVLPLE